MQDFSRIPGLNCVGTLQRIASIRIAGKVREAVRDSQRKCRWEQVRKRRRTFRPVKIRQPPVKAPPPSPKLWRVKNIGRASRRSGAQDALGPSLSVLKFDPPTPFSSENPSKVVWQSGDLGDGFHRQPAPEFLALHAQILRHNCQR